MVIILTFLAAAFYVLAAYLMKLWQAIPWFLAAPGILFALSLAAVIEVEALRTGRLGSTFLFILGFEVMLTVVCALLVFGESYTLREIAGLMVMVGGMAIVAWPATKAGDAGMQRSPGASLHREAPAMANAVVADRVVPAGDAVQ